MTTLNDSAERFTESTLSGEPAVSGGVGTPASSVVASTTWAQDAVVGTETDYARADHVHGTPADPTGVPATTIVHSTTWGQAAAVGTSGNFAREDHVHGTPANPTTPPAGTPPTLTDVALVDLYAVVTKSGTDEILTDTALGIEWTLPTFAYYDAVVVRAWDDPDNSQADRTWDEAGYFEYVLPPTGDTTYATATRYRADFYPRKTRAQVEIPGNYGLRFGGLTLQSTAQQFLVCARGLDGTLSTPVLLRKMEAVSHPAANPDVAPTLMSSLATPANGQRPYWDTALGGLSFDDGVAGTVTTGTWEPTYLVTGGILAILPLTPNPRYMRAGDVVECEGVCSVEADGSGTPIQFLVTLPFATSFAETTAIRGVALFALAGTIYPGIIRADATLGHATIAIPAGVVGGVGEVSYSFSYIVTVLA